MIKRFSIESIHILHTQHPVGLVWSLLQFKSSISILVKAKYIKPKITLSVCVSNRSNMMFMFYNRFMFTIASIILWILYCFSFNFCHSQFTALFTISINQMIANRWMVNVTTDLENTHCSSYSQYWSSALDYPMVSDKCQRKREESNEKRVKEIEIRMKK